MEKSSCTPRCIPTRIAEEYSPSAGWEAKSDPGYDPATCRCSLWWERRLTCYVARSLSSSRGGRWRGRTGGNWYFWGSSSSNPKPDISLMGPSLHCGQSDGIVQSIHDNYVRSCTLFQMECWCQRHEEQMGCNYNCAVAGDFIYLGQHWGRRLGLSNYIHLIIDEWIN